MKECDILKTLLELFTNFNDFSIEHDVKISEGRGKIYLDAVIKYGNQCFACVEIKKDINNEKQQNELINHIERQVSLIKWSISTLKFFFCLVGEKYYYLNSDNKLVKDTGKGVFDLLIKSIEDNAAFCDDLINPYKSKIRSNDRWGKYGEILEKHLLEGHLRKYGDIVFLDKNEEMKLLHELLIYESGNDMPKEICRYTSDKTFCLSIGDKFRLNSVEAMNDTLETKVINNYKNLSNTKYELSEYIYKGFIMSFSSINRKDKLSSWYMYGQHAKGVCFVSKLKHNYSEEEFIAPVIYVSAPSLKRQFFILDFLNEIMDCCVNGNYRFKLRYWHFWKYFFKYDFYKEEEEVRVLYIKKDDFKIAFSDEYSTPYYYIEESIDKLPFKITEVVLGPKLESREDYKCFVEEKLGCGVSNSVIVGYR